MGAVAGNAAAMRIVAGNATALEIVLSATNNVGKALNQIIINNGGTTNTTLAGLATMADVAGDATAMGAVAGNATAIGIVARSSTALTALNASDTAMNALYASALIVKVSYEAGSIWYTGATPYLGIGLFVRLTSKGNAAAWAGWYDGLIGYEWVKYDYDSAPTYYPTRNVNPYNHTALTALPRLPMRRFTVGITLAGYNPIEIAYIPLTA